MTIYIAAENGSYGPINPTKINANTPKEAAYCWARREVANWGPGDGRDQLDIIVTLEGVKHGDEIEDGPDQNILGGR